MRGDGCFAQAGSWPASWAPRCRGTASLGTPSTRPRGESGVDCIKRNETLLVQYFWWQIVNIWQIQSFFFIPRT